jgi:DNA-binding response OmpR family regulator
MIDVAERHEVAAGEGTKTHMVMVVDDEQNMCEALKRILEAQGFRVVVAMDERTVMRLVNKEKPDLILLDVTKPRMYSKLCEKVRWVSDCRIVYLSGRFNLLKSPDKSSVKDRVDAFITKPASAKRIISVVDSTLAKKHRNRQTTTD